MEWRALVTTSDALGRYDRLVVARCFRDRTEYITGFTEAGTPIMESFPVDIQPESRVELTLPAGAAQAIAEAVKPGPDSKEVGRLEEALKIERERVDRLLAWTTTR